MDVVMAVSVERRLQNFVPAKGAWVITQINKLCCTNTQMHDFHINCPTQKYLCHFALDHT